MTVAKSDWLKYVPIWVLTPIESTNFAAASGVSDCVKVGDADGFAVAVCKGVGVDVGAAEGRTLCVGLGESVGLALETEVGALVGNLALLLLDGNGVGEAVAVCGVADALAAGDDAGEAFASGVSVDETKGAEPTASFWGTADPPELEHPENKVATQKSTATSFNIRTISYRALDRIEEVLFREGVRVNT